MLGDLGLPWDGMGQGTSAHHHVHPWLLKISQEPSNAGLPPIANFRPKGSDGSRSLGGEAKRQRAHQISWHLLAVAWLAKSMWKPGTWLLKL